MAKDERYKTGKELIEAGYFQSFRQIFDHIPPSTVFKDMGMNYIRFTKMIDKPILFKLQELEFLAGLFGIDPKILIDLAWNQHVEDKAKKRKGKY